jgi:hypothetical protein
VDRLGRLEEAKRLLQWCRLYVVDRKGYFRTDMEERARLGAELDAWLGNSRNPTKQVSNQREMPKSGK